MYICRSNTEYSLYYSVNALNIAMPSTASPGGGGGGGDASQSSQYAHTMQASGKPQVRGKCVDHFACMPILYFSSVTLCEMGLYGLEIFSIVRTYNV